MGDVVKLSGIGHQCAEEAAKLIAGEVAEAEIVAVAAVLVRKDGGVTRIISEHIENVHEMIGALEVLKHDLLPERLMGNDDE